MMTACTQEELIPNDAIQGMAKGIVFESNPTSSETRGELTQEADGNYYFDWYAEFDKVNVYASNVMGQNAPYGGENSTGKGVANAEFDNDDLTPAVYKATTSGSRGLFTANSDEDWISFNNNAEKVVAIATYPLNTTIKSVDAEKESRYESWGGYICDVTKKVKKVVLNTTVAAHQRTAFNYVSAPMLSITETNKEARHQSVSEKMPLDFYRIYPVIRFTGKPGNDSYNYDLGKLLSITLKSNGATNGDYRLSAQQLAGTADYRHDNNTISNVTNTSTSVTVNINPNEPAWTSDKSVYMSILPVKMQGAHKNNANDKCQLADNLTITYEYENITLVKNTPSGTNGWTEINKVYPAPVLDIANEYKYIVTKGNAGEGRKLIVNSDNLPSITDGYILWNDAYSEEYNHDKSSNGSKEKVVAISNITEIEVRSGANVINAEGFKNLRNYANLKKLSIKNNTTVLTKNALQGLSNLESLELTNVNNVEYDVRYTDWNRPVETAKLTTVIMPSYDFSTSVNLTQAILGAPGASVLQTLDMRGVESMKQIYPKEGMTLMNYANLKKVTVQDGVILGPEAFKGCVKLTTVNGKVFLGGYSEFENCASVNSINLSDGTNIPEYSFKGATALTSIKANGVNIAPQTIGISAFQDATSLVNINLGNTTTIGANAFNGCTSFKGVHDNNKQIWTLDVNAATIGASAFASTMVQYVKFANLTTVESNLLKDAGKLTQLKFAKIVSFSSDAYTYAGTTFGTSGNITLFVNPGQETEANKLKVKYSNKADKDVTFKTIVKE